MKKLLVLFLFGLSACGNEERVFIDKSHKPTPYYRDPTGVVKAAAIVQVSTSSGQYANALVAGSGSTPVTYNNAASVTFTLNTTNLGPAGFVGDSLNLGSITISALNDNHLKVCGTGSTKCTQAIIRIYTTGGLQGFVNTADSYGVDLFAGLLNPLTPVGLTASGAVQMHVITIAANKNRIKLSDFTTPTYPITADFSNAGSGTYSATLVIELVLN